VDDMATQAYDNMSQGGGDVRDEEMMTLEYDAEPATNDPKTGGDKQESQDAVPTQVIDELDQCVGRLGGNREGSAEAMSPSLSTAPTQVFDPTQSQSQSQSDGIATQTFDAGNSRQSSSQPDFLATQVFDAVSTTRKNSDGSPRLNSASSSQAEPATQVFEAVATMHGKSDGSPGSSSRPSNSETDLLPTQAFSEPAAIGTAQRRPRGSPQQSTQTFSNTNPPLRTSGVGRDGTRISFSPQSYSTQEFRGEADFPHLTLEMSECSESHEDRSSVTAAEARVSSLRQVSLSIGSRPSDHYFRSVCLSVCLFVCLFVQSFSQPSLI